MPKKLQIKLLSQSAELLNVTNCLAGQVSVLRSESPSELKPYQRALSGIQGRERFVITVDGSEYRPDQHNLIGFGEVAPHSGMTVSSYLSSVGILEGAISGLLVSFGIEGIADKLCSSLSPDEERKVRLFAATADPSKALIINEPFEPISSQWRVNVAELLLDFATSKNGLVVIPSLSYRPDAWVDNQAITRHQVGQSLRKTIGFGSADSESTNMMNQIRDLVRENPASSIQGESRRSGAAASLGAAAIGLAQGGVNEGSFSDSRVSPSAPSVKISVSKALGAATLCGLIMWGTVKLIPQRGEDVALNATNSPQISPETQQQPAPSDPSPPLPSDASQKVAEGSKEGVPGKKVGVETVQVALVLDKYPLAIRQSILDTAHGVIGEIPRIDQPQEAQKVGAHPQDEEGNLYKLLEKAGTQGRSGDDQPPAFDSSDSVDDDSGDIAQLEPDADPDQESRREEIRQKFLQAIQAAAQNQDE